MNTNTNANATMNATMNTSIVQFARKVFITLLTLDLRSVNYDVYVYLMPQTDLHNLNFG